MFTVKYNTYSKEHVIYKDDIHCATLTNYNLRLESSFTFTIEEICEILALTNVN